MPAAKTYKIENLSPMRRGFGPVKSAKGEVLKLRLGRPAEKDEDLEARRAAAWERGPKPGSECEEDSLEELMEGPYPAPVDSVAPGIPQWAHDKLMAQPNFAALVESGDLKVTAE